MKKTCPNCNLANFGNAATCARCQSDLKEIPVSSQSGSSQNPALPKFIKRLIVCIFAVLIAVAGFYLSLLMTAKKLSYDEKRQISSAIKLLEEKGFTKETFFLNYLTAYRANDNWLNASIEKENAYAATNFPFEIMTVYPEFFTVPLDETERAAILLHEAQHLKGADEKDAYEFVWKNRAKLGWTKDKYARSVIWRNVRKQTKEYAPQLFTCDAKEYGDCTE